MKHKECRFFHSNIFDFNGKTYEQSWCKLTNLAVKGDAETDCNLGKIDLSKMDICYNCEHYKGGLDWGLFCSHEENYHRIGQWDSKPCEFYKKKVN